MASSLIYCITVILLVATAAWARSTGAPLEACGIDTDIAPDHAGISPSDDPLPYSVDLSDFNGGEYIPGNTYIITLSGSTDDPDFRGFMIQGRVVSGDSPTGQFTGEPGVSQPQCADDTAATHVDSSEKTSVNLMWTAPPAGTGAVKFRFAFVDMFALFWDNQCTSIIQEGLPPAASRPPITTATTDTPATTATTETPATTATTDAPATTATTETPATTATTDTPATTATTETPATTATTDTPATTATTDTPATTATTDTPATTATTDTPATTATTDTPPTTATTDTLPTTATTDTPPTTASTETPTTRATTETPTITGPPPSCEGITGFPECNEKLCSSRRNRYKRCFIVKDSCTKKCQVSRCLTCEYTRQLVKRPQPQRPSCVPCKTYYDRACWHRYYTCRYNYYRTSGYYYSRYYYQQYERVFKCFTQCQ